MADFLEKLKKGMGATPSSLEGITERELKEDNVDKTKKDEIKSSVFEQPLPEKKKKKKTKEAKVMKEIKKTNETNETNETDEIKETKVAKGIKEAKDSKKIEIKEEFESEKEKAELKKEFQEKSWLEPEGQLTVDVYQTNGEIVIQSAIAGIRPENIEISIENDLVSIRGKREETQEKEGKNYFYKECYWGRFSREIILPSEVDASRAQAKMKEGILTIRIPKIEKEKKRKISVD